MVTLILDSKPVSVLCHMGDFGLGDGGWTPVMKIDGNKVLRLFYLSFINLYLKLGPLLARLQNGPYFCTSSVV